MKIVEERIYAGANCFLEVPTIVLVVERDPTTPSFDLADIANAADHINEAIRELDNPFRPARVAALRPARSAGELMADLALVLQRQFVCTAQLSQVKESKRRGATVIAFESRHPRLGVLAGRCAVGICKSALSATGDGKQSLANLVAEFKAAAAAIVPTIETRLLLNEADRRGIPWFRLAENIPVVQLGQGVRRRRFRNSLTDGTGDTAYRLASFKPLAAHLLHDHGIPVPQQGTAETEDHAVALARRFGFPVVVKPVGMDMGVGVRVGIANENDLRSAYRATKVHGAVQVERYLPGFDHRFTFIHGRLVGVLRTSPPIIEGDGIATVRQLVDAEPSTTATVARRKIIVDNEVLGRIRDAGYEMGHVLRAGQRIVLRHWWRNQPDHMLENVTAIAHPENVDAALLAVQLIGLDVAGADYITTDISRPFHETGGAFTEVNPMPAMAGVQRSGIAAYPMLLDAMFPGGDTGRIDTAVLLGTRRADAVAASIEAVLAHAGHQVGVATLSRLEVAGQLVRKQVPTEAARARLVLHHPRATAAILQATEAAIVAEGLGLDRCRVGALLMPAADADNAAADAGEESIEIIRLLCAITDGAIVLDVEDPRAPHVVSAAPAARILWTNSTADRRFSLQRSGDALVAARPKDGNSVIVFDDGQTTQELAAIGDGSKGNETDREALRARLISIAVAVGLGMGAESIRNAIETIERPSP